MRFIRLPISASFSTYFGIGTWIFLIVSLLGLMILLWISIIIIGNFLLIGNLFNPYESTMQIKAFYSIASVLVGLFMANFIIKIADFYDKSLSQQNSGVRSQNSVGYSLRLADSVALARNERLDSEF